MGIQPSKSMGAGDMISKKSKYSPIENEGGGAIHWSVFNYIIPNRHAGRKTAIPIIISASRITMEKFFKKFDTSLKFKI